MDEEQKIRLVNHWIKSADADYVTVNHLFETKDYPWALFIGHLVIEKLLKALFIQHKSEHPLFTHDLLRLAQKCDLELSQQHSHWLESINRFNLKARYDDYKDNFRITCTQEFTQYWIGNIKELALWLKAKF